MLIYGYFMAYPFTLVIYDLNIAILIFNSYSTPSNRNPFGSFQLNYILILLKIIIQSDHLPHVPSCAIWNKWCIVTQVDNFLTIQKVIES